MGAIPPAAALTGVPTMSVPQPPPLRPILSEYTTPIAQPVVAANPPSRPSATTPIAQPVVAAHLPSLPSATIPIAQPVAAAHLPSLPSATIPIAQPVAAAHLPSLPSTTSPAQGPSSNGLPGPQGPSATTGGSFLGDTMCPLPEALRKRILNLEYIDMADLQPEAWLFDGGAEDKTLASLFKKRKEPVTDILVWVQCYNAMVAVLTERFPQFIHQFLAYQSHIIRSYKKSRALEWVAYDMAYRRKAAYMKSLNWAVIDQNLSATWFSGAGRPPSCMHCLSEAHTSNSCPHLVENVLAPLATAGPQWAVTQWEGPKRGPPQTQQPWRPPMSQAYPPQATGPYRAPQGFSDKTLCGLFNSTEGQICHYGEACKFDHRCRLCGGPHPASSCYQPQRQRGGMKRPFMGKGWPGPPKGRKY